jgi:hypothetical protein
MLKYSKLVLLLSLLTVSFSAQAHPRNGDCSGAKVGLHLLLYILKMKKMVFAVFLGGIVK